MSAFTKPLAQVREALVSKYRDKEGDASFFALDELPEFEALAQVERLATEMEAFKGDVMAGCDIQNGDRLYRQKEVVIGPGLTKDEARLADLEQLATDMKTALRAALNYIGIDWDESYPDEPSFVTTGRAVFSASGTPEGVAREEGTP